MQLNEYDNRSFQRGASKLKEMLWYCFGATLLQSRFPGSAWRCVLLRAFGAKIGRAVVIKPEVHIKFPWRLSVGDYSWIGEKAWLDNLDWIRIGANVCISQGAYLGTGNHDWSDPRFGLITSPVAVADQAWVGAHARLAPGSVLEQGAVIAQGAVMGGRAVAWTIYAGNPAQAVRARKKAGSAVSRQAENQPVPN